MKTEKNDIVPTYDELMWPTLKALKALGGSASNDEILDKIIELEAYSEEVQNFPHPNKPITQLDYRCAWARTYLKKVGAITNSAKGVWSILENGEKLSELDMQKIPAQVNKLDQLKKREKKQTRQSSKKEDAYEDVDEATFEWYEVLLSQVLTITPAAFERLCQRILRESGFSKVEVTGKVGDGGVDGKGILKINLISFHVAFQAKRWKGPIGSGEIRNFRGSISGRADKGIFITTGNFSSDARKEATRDGAMTIDLIDGRDLCELMKNLGLGTKVETVEQVEINADWLKDL